MEKILEIYWDEKNHCYHHKYNNSLEFEFFSKENGALLMCSVLESFYHIHEKVAAQYGQQSGANPTKEDYIQTMREYMGNIDEIIKRDI